MGELQENKSRSKLTRTAALLAMLLASPVFLFFIYLHKVEEGIGAWICAGIVVVSIIVRWDLRSSVWFWVAISIGALLQVPFVLFVPWTNRYMSFVSFLPFGLLDYALVYGCIKLAEKVMGRGDAASSQV
ncbi:MAG: hypothetical protein ACYCOR_13995 [Acidobacteriaceae bacterium]